MVKGELRANSGWWGTLRAATVSAGLKRGGGFVADLERAVLHLQEALSALDVPDAASSGRRMAELLAEFRPRPAPRISVFPFAGRSAPILARGVVFHSLCAHHLVPFFGTLDLVYLPREHIGGMSGVTTLVAALSRQPRLQEDLARAIADAWFDAVRPWGVLIRVRARQMCVELRGGGQPEFECWADHVDPASPYPSDVLRDALTTAR